MAIIGIESLVYGVTDVEESARFFEDFGLIRDPAQVAPGTVSFILPEGSRVHIMHRGHPKLSRSKIDGDGVHEVIWGVRDAVSLDRIAESLAIDRDVSRDDDNVVRFMADFGVPMGLRVFEPNPVVTAPDPHNSPGNVNRLNQHRKWRLRARPKVISHVVFSVPDYQAGATFLRERLNFRLSDSQRGFGKYLRAEASGAHHSILLLNAKAPIPGMDGRLTFHHANFGVEDVDELMIGANHMARQGWDASHWGFGRHRIDSGLFYYIPSPAGGEAEYGADADVVDDSWVPRNWTNPLFGVAHYMSNMPDFFRTEPEWSFDYITDGKMPADADISGSDH